MKEAFIFIVHNLLQLLVTAFLLRLLLPLVRADARNPISQAVITVTNPMVRPLRYVLPIIGRWDLAALCAVCAVQLITTIIVLYLRNIPLQLLTVVLPVAGRGLALTLLNFYFFTVLIYVLLSWIAPGARSPASGLLSNLCEPLLKPVRNLIPPLAGIDLSALFVLIGIQALQIIINQL